MSHLCTYLTYGGVGTGLVCAFLLGKNSATRTPSAAAAPKPPAIQVARAPACIGPVALPAPTSEEESSTRTEDGRPPPRQAEVADEPAAEEPDFEDPRAASRKRLSFLEETFKSEPLDGPWARESYFVIRNGLSRHIESNRILSIECRRTMCRAEFTNGDETSYHAAAQEIVGDRFWNGEGFMTAKDAARQDYAAILYLGRDGGELPRAD